MNALFASKLQVLPGTINAIWMLVLLQKERALLVPISHLH